MSVPNLRTRSLAFLGLRAPVVTPGNRPSEGDRNAERLLEILGGSEMSIAALRDMGIRSPAQGLYDLLVAGYPIERIMTGGGAAVRYRLKPG